MFYSFNTLKRMKPVILPRTRPQIFSIVEKGTGIRTANDDNVLPTSL